MKKRVILSMMLGILGVLAMLALGGCGSKHSQDDWFHGQDIPVEISFKGYFYKITDETVAAIKIVPDNLVFIGHGILVGSPSPSPTGECNPEPVYEVYSIQGIDENEAIAVKFGLVGKSGAYYVFFKYQRE
jgi:hypothetical protein